LLADQGKTKYLEVYPGSPNPIPEHLYSTSNPDIQYQQGEEMSCAFFSMASVLYYLGYYTISSYLLDSCHEFIKDSKKRENDNLENSSVKPSRKRKRYHHTMLQKERPERWL
jgi:hypothetical protein